jgi:hypothetical protein
MIRRIALACLVALAALLATGQALAVPNLLQFQGKLTDASGNNVANGNYSVVFRIYALAAGGSALWTETQANVTVANGLFNVALGSVTAFPANLFDGSDRYLGITVAADPEMAPRQRITSVAYALRSGSLDVAPGVTSRVASSRFQAVGVIDTVLSATITIPAAGYVLVHAGGSGILFHTTGTASDVRFNISETAASVTFSAGWQECYTPSQAPSGLYLEEFHCTRLFSKAAGTYRFFLNMSTVSGGSNGVEQPFVIATYFPAAYGPVLPAPPGGEPVQGSEEPQTSRAGR